MSTRIITELPNREYELPQPIRVHITKIPTPEQPNYQAGVWSCYLRGPHAKDEDLAVRELLDRLVHIRNSLEHPNVTHNNYALQAHELLRERFVKP